jgi:hypothetical protein
MGERRLEPSFDRLSPARSGRTDVSRRSFAQHEFIEVFRNEQRNKKRWNREECGP